MTPILVTGDRVRNTNLVRLPPGSAATWNQLPGTALRRTPGGSPYLKDIIALACSDLDICVAGPGADRHVGKRVDETQPETVTIWTRYERTIGSGRWVWRVEQFLSAISADEREEHLAQATVSHTSWQDEPFQDRERERKILVLDDENFGFRDQPAQWSETLRLLRPDDHIVLKTRAPLADGALWDALVADHLHQLTVVTPVSSLRVARASIARGLSWDRAIEDVHRELVDGPRARDIGRARQVIIPFSFDGAAVFSGDGAGGVTLDRFVYHPERLEGEGRSRQPGMSLGGASIMTAAVVRHLARPEDYPLFVAIGRALALMAASHERGGGEAREDQDMAEILIPFTEDEDAQREIRALLHWHDGQPGKDHHASGLASPEAPYRSAFHLPSQRTVDRAEASPFSCSLVNEVTGPGPGHYLATGTQVVILGQAGVLDSVPKVRYADFLTVDREEIERTNEIRRLFDAYRANTDPKPLSIAVFGPPGSGKSFAIKQISKHLFGQDREVLEWNLSQLVDRDDLLSAFDVIRDASVRGKIPLVFWDEFDTSDLAWVKEFLMPMQDAQYCTGSMTHPFGKSIFVFAGGTSSTFQEFDRSRAHDPAFRHRKGPDFVSRLRGYLNIKGPNPQGSTGPMSEPQADFFHRPVHDDMAYVLRRALLLRSLIARSHPNLLDPATGVAAISPGVVRGFLCADQFFHGARSMEAIVSMSELAGASYFGIAELPSPSLLNLHVSPDFMDHVREGEGQEEAVEILASSSAWTDLDSARIHDCEVYRHLSRVLLEELRQRGYLVRRAPGRAEPARGAGVIPERVLDALSRSLHEKWLQDRLLCGYELSDKADDQLRLHPNIRDYDDLPIEVRRRSRTALASILDTLNERAHTITAVDTA